MLDDVEECVPLSSGGGGQVGRETKGCRVSVNRFSNVCMPRKRARETGGIFSFLCPTGRSELVNGIVQKKRKGKRAPSINHAAYRVAVPSNPFVSNPQKKGIRNSEPDGEMR